MGVAFGGTPGVQVFPTLEPTTATQKFSTQSLHFSWSSAPSARAFSPVFPVWPGWDPKRRLRRDPERVPRLAGFLFRFRVDLLTRGFKGVLFGGF